MLREALLQRAVMHAALLTAAECPHVLHPSNRSSRALTTTILVFLTTRALACGTKDGRS